MTAFADIILLSFNAATAIIFQVILSIIVLKEVFVCRFDLPALILIIAGSMCIILTANFSDVESNVATLKGHLSSGKSIAFYSFTFILINLTFIAVRRMLKYLAIFELETEIYLNMNAAGPDDRESTLSRGSDVHLPRSGSSSLVNEIASHYGDDCEATISRDNDYKRVQVTDRPDFEQVPTSEALNEPRRTSRVLLGLIGKMPDELLAKISPKFGRRLKKFMKVPRVLLTLASGLCGGTSLVLMKVFGEIVNSDERSANVYLALTLCLVGLSCAAM